MTNTEVARSARKTGFLNCEQLAAQGQSIQSVRLSECASNAFLEEHQAVYTPPEFQNVTGPFVGLGAKLVYAANTEVSPPKS
jgi:hypothetical protein